MSDHTEMAGMLWSCYKARMGQSDGIDMKFDLPRLIKRVEGLDILTEPFSTEEMDLVVKEMTAHKAPGPDGFNGLFLKKCWPLIKEDFYKLANVFQEEKVNLQNINGSYITLVPKVNSPEDVNDFRPIF